MNTADSLHPRTNKEAEMLRDAWSAIAAGQPDAAFSCISTLPLDMPAARNARAVCLMMQGEYQRALDLLRPMIFPEDGLVMDPDADPAWRANFVLALLRAGSQDGFRTYADQLEPADHPAVRAIRNLLSPPSRKGLGRFLGFLGGPPLVALPRDFPAGWPESELQENRDNSGPAGVTVPGSSAVGVAVRPLSSGKAPGLTMAFATARPPAIVWKARPIFISSTFRDMHAERDWLRENAFLRLGERLRERCHYLDAIDLRQGVENASEQDEAKREMQVLKVCLDEIERSKPFLVALIGDRYGWVPPADRIVAAARAAGLPTSIDVAGRSVTELEILFGVLENADQRKRSWFFFRNLDRATMPPEVAARFPAEAPSDDPESPAGRLRTLKDRIRREIPERVLEYPLRWDSGKGAFVGLEELDKRIEEALWSDLDAETAVFLRHTPRTWQEADARAVGDFVTERTRGYVERPAVTDPMLAHAASPPSPGADWGLIITGAPGNGKSSLFGHVYGALQSRAEAGEIVLLAHAAGIYPMSGQVDRMLRRWVTELSAALGQPDPLDGAESQAMQHPDGSSKFASADIETTFASLLDQAAAARRVVVLVDALNQFEPTLRAQYMTWLPRSWPANARFIATAVAGRATSALTDRPRCREQLVPPVSIEEAREIARRFYRERHHRDVNPRALATLLEKKLPDGRPAHGNPLWLALALQEMNLLEADDFERAAREYANLSDAARMDALQVSETSKLPADVPGVYGELLSRAERNWGKAWTDAFIGLTAVSRAGWRESDLRALMPRISGQAWDELAFAGIRRALGTHVVQRGAQAQWDFSHATLRDAVLDRYLADQAARRHLHGLIVDHLESLPSLPAADPVRITETMVHLLCFGDQDRAAAYVAYVAGPQKYFNPSATGEAVAVLVDAIQAAQDDAQCDLLTDWIAGLLKTNNGANVADVIVRRLGKALAAIGSSRAERSRERLLHEAGAVLKRLAKTEDTSLDQQSPLTHVPLDQLPKGMQRGGVGYVLVDKSIETEFARSLLSSCRDDLGDAMMSRGELAGAAGAYQESQSLRRRSRMHESNPVPPDIVSQVKMADILLARGDLPAAANAYQDIVNNIRRYAVFPDLKMFQLQIECRMGDILCEQGNLEGALRIYRESLAAQERMASATLSKKESLTLKPLPGNAGDDQDTQRRLARTLANIDRRNLACASDPPITDWQLAISKNHGKIGTILHRLGDMAGALDACRKSAELAARLADVDPMNAGWQHNLAMREDELGGILLECGDLDEALNAYHRSGSILERLVVANPSNLLWKYNFAMFRGNVGNVLRDRGDLDGAIKAYREALAMTNRLVMASPSKASYQYALVIGHQKIGDLLVVQRDQEGAFKAYQESLAVAVRLTAIDPSNADWQHGLWIAYSRMGTISEETGRLDAREWWRKAYDQLISMKRRGISRADDEQFLAPLKEKIRGRSGQT